MRFYQYLHIFLDNFLRNFSNEKKNTFYFEAKKT